MNQRSRRAIVICGALTWAGTSLAAQTGSAAGPGSYSTLRVLAPTRLSNNAKELRIEYGILASRPGDSRVYLLLGSGWIRALRFGDPGKFVSEWLALHPGAIYTPISRELSTNTKTRIQFETVYIWIEDGPDSLNVDLVRNGVFQGATMFDMVDNQQGLDRLLSSDPRLADTRALIAKERAAAPQDRTERLIAEDAYKARILRVEEAERHARAEKLGIWSDAMSDEREAEGVS